MTATAPEEDRSDVAHPSPSRPTAAVVVSPERQEEARTSNNTNPKIQELQRKLAKVKQRRDMVEATRRDHGQIKQRLLDHVHATRLDYEVRHGDWIAWKLQHQQTQKQLDESQTWNVLNDAFDIWHSGPFGTINGNRLGAEAIVTAQQPQQHSSSGASKMTPGDGDETAGSHSSMTTAALGAVAATVFSPGRYLGFSSSSSSDQQHPVPSNPSHLDAANHNNSNPASLTTTIRVPWTEINSALGQIALLLSTLEKTPHAGISFPHHVIIPQGSTSKIGLRQPNAITGHSSQREVPVVAMYHLYSDDSFQLFGKRNFNLALRALTECLARAAQAIEQRDRTMVMPFAMQVEHDNPSAPCTINGLPVQYSGTDGITWTRVMKYLLTNVKWCVAYAVKHLDR
jgi:hypothetical protein